MVTDQDKTAPLPDQEAIESLTNLVAATHTHQEATAAFHKASDELLQTSHLLLEAHNLGKSYDHMASCVKLHAAAHKAFGIAKAAHKKAHEAHNATCVKCYKTLAKVINGGPEVATQEGVESEPARLSTATAKAAFAGLAKALRVSGVNVNTRHRANDSHPFFKGAGWSQPGTPVEERGEDRGAGLAKGR